MKGVLSMSHAQQGMAAASVYASRLIAQADKPGDHRLENAGKLIRQINADTMAEFIVRPEVRNVGKGAAAVAAAYTIPHFIENTVAGTAAMKQFGAQLMKSYPQIARILQRNPNAAVVAGTVAFPYVIAPLLERWFKDLLEVQRVPGSAPPDWRPGFMSTVLNWNHVQPLLNAALVNHPALLIMAGPLATGLLSAGVETLNTTEAYRLAAERAAAGGTDLQADTSPPSPTPSEQAVGKAVASQVRYFMDTVRQSLRKHPYLPNVATEIVTTSLYPGWVAAVSNLYARCLAERMSADRELKQKGSSAVVDSNTPLREPADAEELDALDPGALDIEAMLRSEGARELLEMLAARPDLFAPSRALRSASRPPNELPSRSESFEEIDPMGSGTAPRPGS